MRRNRLTTFIVIGLVVGIVAGYASHSLYPQDSARFAELTSLLPGAFLRLIKMIISPLVFSTLGVGVAILWLALIALGALVIGPRVMRLVRRIRKPVVLAFSTARSEAAYPRTLEELERFGVSNRIASFVLPVGYSFNLDGSMMYCSFAVMFIAQVYGMDIPVGQQILMVAILMLTSKGIAGVPRASLVVVAATLAQFNIPEAGIFLLLGINHFLDMGRSATNVVGNSIATAVVPKWEKELGPEEPVAGSAAGPANAGVSAS